MTQWTQDQPPYDESQKPDDGAGNASFNELRGTVSEITRIVSVRRWMFFIPFCIVTTGAFLLSLYVPRRYEALTAFERRDDPVLMNLPRANGTGAFEIFRRTLVQDVTNPRQLLAVVRKLKLAERAAKNDKGGKRIAESILANRIAAGLKVSFRQRSEHLDVIEIKYTTSDVDTMIPVLNEVRENYIRQTQKRINKHLSEAKSWFDRECEKRQIEIDDLNADLVAFKAQNRGFDPLNPDAVMIELTQLKSDLNELERKGRDLAIRLDGRKRMLEAPPVIPSTPGLPVRATPLSPKAAALLRQMDTIEEQIEELQSTRGMTDRHPRIVHLRDKWDQLAIDLERQQAQDAANVTLAAAGSSSGRAITPWDAARNEAQNEILVLQQLLADNEAELKKQRAAVRELEGLKAKAAERHREFSQRRAEIKRLNEDLVLYRRYADQVGRLLAADNSQRGILFEGIKPASGRKTPVSPRVATVFLMSMVAGLVSAVVMVLLAELFDRTVRTRRQIVRSLGINILESIDEIATTAARRRRRLRAITVPALSVMLLGMVALSGSVAYLNLENRDLYERTMAVPRRVYQRFVDTMTNDSGVAEATQDRTERTS